MYRIEVAPGEETVFRTIEELAVGIRNGVVTPRARVFHQASQKWLPIGLHPHYKKALEMPASTAHPPVASTPLPSTSRLRSLTPIQPPSLARHPEPKRSPEPTPVPEPKFAPKASAAPRIPAPVQSPVIAMQHEVLRDLPVVSMPEPLPWNGPARRLSTPTIEESPPAMPAPLVHPPTTHAPVVHPPAIHAPVSYAPASYPPVSYAPGPQAPVSQAPVSHASVPQGPMSYGQVPQAPASRAPVSHASAAAYAAPELPVPLGEHRHAGHEEPLRRPTARRSRRMAGRPLMLLGTAAALVCTHLVLSAAPATSTDASETPATSSPEPELFPEPPLPESGEPAAATGSAESGAGEAPRVTIAPARVPMIPGPAFAGSVPARAGTDSIAATRSPAPAPAPVPTAPPAIAPAPGAIELALPDLSSDSVVPSARTSDTLGMKKILRALNGARPAEASASP